MLLQLRLGLAPFRQPPGEGHTEQQSHNGHDREAPEPPPVEIVFQMTDAHGDSAIARIELGRTQAALQPLRPVIHAVNQQLAAGVPVVRAAGTQVERCVHEMQPRLGSLLQVATLIEQMGATIVELAPRDGMVPFRVSRA